MTAPVEYWDSCIDWPVPSRVDPPVPPGATYPDVPVLVLSGDLDSLTSPEGAMATADAFPNATFVSVANGTHVEALSDYNRCAGYRGVGLRGGTWVTFGYDKVGFKLHEVAWVEDATVDGSVTWDRTTGRIAGDVRVSGPGVVGGMLHLAWSDWEPLSMGTATGTVGGQPVKLEFLAP